MTKKSEDQRSDRERLYDEEIAPALHSVVQQCEDAGMNIIVMVEFEQAHCARSGVEQPGACVAFQLARLAVEAMGDFDRIVASVMKAAEVHGHKSTFLRQLGVPNSPHDRSLH